MANPQTENGYTKIANEIMAALFSFPFTGREFRVLIFILRKTYGYSKNIDRISLSQFVDECKIDRSSICKILKNLVARKTLLKKENRYMFNKNYDEWVVVMKPLVVCRPPVASGAEDNLLVARKTTGSGVDATHKRNYTKETITKESARAREPDKKISKEFIRKQKEEIAKKFNWPSQ